MAAGSIVISLLMATGSFETDSKRAEKRLREMEKTAKKVGTAVGVALVGAGTAMAVMAKNAIDGADEMSKLASKIGIGTEELSRLAYAAELSDVSMDSLGNAVKRLGQFQVDALKGGKEQLAILKSIGIEAKDAATGGLRDAGEMLRELADVFASMPDGANKTALAVKLLGRSGADLIPLLNGGSKSLDEFAAKSDAVGYTLKEQTGKAAEAFNDTLTEVGLSVDGLWRQSLPELLPKLQDFADLINSEDFRDGFQTIIGGALTAVGALAKFTTTVANTMNFLGEEVAARLHGPSLEDTVRIEQRIERLKTTMKALQDQGFTDPLAIMDASELIPKDLVSTKDTILKRLQTELDKEENRLEIGYKLNADMASAASGLAEEAKAAITIPDFTGGATGAKGSRIDSGAKDAARAMEELARAEAALYDESIRNVGVQTEQMQAWADMAAMLDGPLAQAQLDHVRRMQDIERIGLAAGKTAAEIAAAKAKEEAAYRATTDAIKAQADALDNRDLIHAMDDFRSIAGEFLVDLPKEGWDAWKDFGDNLQQMLMRIAAQNIIEDLFGEWGTTGKGTTGGGWMAAIASMFGFADGGYTGHGGKHDPKGIVHAGEYVIPADATKRLGVRFLDQLSLAARNGYALGGLTGESGDERHRAATMRLRVPVGTQPKVLLCLR